MDITPKNRVAMAGTVESLTETGVILRCIEQGKTVDPATGELKTYAKSHPVVIPAGGPQLDVGMRIQLLGKIGPTENRIQRLIAYPTTIQSETSGKDMNIAMVIGKIGEVTFWKQNELLGKDAYAETFVRCNGTNVRIKMFNRLAQVMSAAVDGSVVWFEGRVQNRERGNYVSATGDIAIFTEIVAERGKILQAFVKPDPFKGVDFEALESGGEEKQAEEVAPPAPETAKAKRPKKATAEAKALLDSNVPF